MNVFNVSKNFSRKFSKTNFKRNVEMKRDGRGKWFIDGIEPENRTSKKITLIAKSTFLVSFTIGIFFMIDQIGKQKVEKDKSFEESNKVKLIRVWNGFFKKIGNTAKDFLEEREKKKDQEIKQRIMDEAHHLNLKNAEIVKISKE